MATVTPSNSPTFLPTFLPTSQPTFQPTVLPTKLPSVPPTFNPTAAALPLLDEPMFVGGMSFIGVFLSVLILGAIYKRTKANSRSINFLEEIQSGSSSISFNNRRPSGDLDVSAPRTGAVSALFRRVSSGSVGGKESLDETDTPLAMGLRLFPKPRMNSLRVNRVPHQNTISRLLLGGRSRKEDSKPKMVPRYSDLSV